MTKEQVKSKFAELMMEKFNVESQELLDEASFQNDLGLDSLDRVELVMEVETEFQIMLDDFEIEEAGTVELLLEAIYPKVEND